jgi:hypothetical protein
VLGNERVRLDETNGALSDEITRQRGTGCHLVASLAEASANPQSMSTATVRVVAALSVLGRPCAKDEWHDSGRPVARRRSAGVNAATPRRR